MSPKVEATLENFSITDEMVAELDSPNFPGFDKVLEERVNHLEQDIDAIASMTRVVFRKQVLPPRGAAMEHGEYTRELSIRLAHSLAQRVAMLEQVSSCRAVLLKTSLSSDEAQSYFDDIPMIMAVLNK